MNYNNEFNAKIENVILSALREAFVNSHTNVIARVMNVNSTTIDCKPVVSREVNGRKEDLPIFPQVPVVNFLGGSSSIQMPISVGDYCVLFVSERAYDNWYFGNDFERPAHSRIQDYSDCIAFVGLHNKAGELTIPDKIRMVGDAIQLGNYEHTGNRTQTGNYILNGNETINNGNLNIPATADIMIEINGEMVSLRNFLSNHTHGGVQAGGSNTDVPNAL